MKHKIEFNEVCKSCKGTGIYIGMAERDRAGVVCHTCNGTGCHYFSYEYEDFKERKRTDKVIRVFEINPGICIGKGDDLLLRDFGGMDYDKWFKDNPFPDKSENRRFTCPAWWYQLADYSKKPHWCEEYDFYCGSFSSCEQFKNKDQCWKRFDKSMEGSK